LSISAQENGALTGKWGDYEVSDLKFENDKLSLTRTVRMFQQEMKLTYQAVLMDGKLVGQQTGERGSIPAIGSRIKPKPAALGTWQLKIKSPDQETEAGLTLAQKPDGSWTGAWESSMAKNEASNVNFKDGKLSLTLTSISEKKQSKSTLDAVIKDHELTGTLANPKGKMPVQGNRHGANAIGTWALTTESDRGPRTNNLIIYNDLTARYQIMDSYFDVQEINVSDNVLTFKIVTRFGPNEFETSFKGQIEGDTLKGETTTPWGANPTTGKKLTPTKDKK
ncbi:MAG: hypothetical protein JW860_14075, partial [Sedimentisphaerales bacterium]|nr:hypothetical protein [Sedimentisphaerales bacterium]